MTSRSAARPIGLAPAHVGATGIATTSRALGWAAVGLTCLGFALRVWQVGAPSYWGDEMVSVVVARMPATDIPGWLAENDPHPPAYYLALHYWMLFVGQSEFATRTLSVLFGALAVPLLGAVAHRLSRSVGVAVLAMSIVAINPLHIAQAHDARMYPMAVALTLGSLLLAVHLRERSSVVGWSLWALVSVAAVYTHYYTGLVLAAQGLWVLTFVRDDPRFVARYVGASGIVVIAYAPWVLPGLGVVSAYEGYGWSPAEAGWLWPAAALQRCLDTFLTGYWTLTGAPQWALAIGTVVVTVAGAAALWTRDRRATLMALVYLLGPIFVVAVAALQRPIFTPKYLIAASPALYLLLAIGVWRLADRLGSWRLVGATTLVAPFLFAQSAGVTALATSPTLQNADWRAAGAFVTARQRPTDGIIYGHDGVKWLLDFYHPEPIAEYLPPFGVKGRERAIDAALTAFVAQHDRVWFVPWWNSETDVFVEQWLGRAAYPAIDRWLDRSIRVTLWGSPRGPIAQRPVGVAFGEALELVSFGTESRPARPGDIVPYALTWRALDDLDADYKVVIRLLNERGVSLASSDRAPRNAPTSGWPENLTLMDRVGLFIPIGTPPGTYRAAIDVYDSATGARLPVVGVAGARFDLGEVTVLPSDGTNNPAAIDAAPRNDDFGATRLVGVSLSGGDRIAGDIAPITLFWRGAASDARLVLGDPTRPLAETSVATNPLGQVTDAIVRIDTTIWAPPSTPTGQHPLWIIVGARRAQIGALSVRAREAIPSPPPPTTRLDARIGPDFRLVGATAQWEHDSLRVSLVWQTTREQPQRLTAFVHLVDATGRIVAQSDHEPGGVPTSRWRADELVGDVHRLRVAALPDGASLLVGLYESATLERVGATSIPLP